MARVCESLATAALVAALAAGCQFDASSAPYATGPGPDAGADASPDGPAPTDAPGDGAPGPAPTDCPAGFVSVDGAPPTSKYLAVADDANWANARFDCHSLAASDAVARTHLVTLETPAELAALGGLFDGDDQQLGLSRLPFTTAWEWVTGTAADVAALPWDEDGPDSNSNCAAVIFVDNPRGNDDVARVRAVSCISGTQRQVVCECEAGVGDALFDN